MVCKPHMLTEGEWSDLSVNKLIQAPSKFASQNTNLMPCNILYSHFFEKLTVGVYLTQLITGQGSSKTFTREVFPSQHPPEPPCSDSDDAFSCENGSGIDSSERLIGLTDRCLEKPPLGWLIMILIKHSYCLSLSI